MAHVVRQPAFIAGVGVAAWLVLMGFSGLLYCRHRRRKQLGHYTTSFAYTPAVGFAHSEGSGIMNAGPGMLGSNMGNYPWLADSWPTPNLSNSGKDAVNCCASKGDSDRYYNALGIISYPNQSEKHSATSNDSPIYSTINATAEDDLLAYYDTYSTSYNQGPDPYSSNPVLANTGFMGLDHNLDHWTIQSGHSGSEYAKLQYTKKTGDKLLQQRSLGSSCKAATLNWADVLSLPLPASKDPSHAKTDQEDEKTHSSEDEDEDWCPPLPARTYLMDTSREELSSPPSKSDEPRLTASPSGDGPRLQHFDLLERHQSDSQVNRSDPDLFTNSRTGDLSEDDHSSRWVDDFKGDDGGEERYRPAAAESSPAAPQHRSRREKKNSKDRQVWQELHQQTELAPPPAPPPVESLQFLSDVLNRGRTDGERKEGSGSLTLHKRDEHFSAQRRGQAKWFSPEETSYSQSSFSTKVQTSGYGSLGGDFPRPATSSRRTDEKPM